MSTTITQSRDSSGLPGSTQRDSLIQLNQAIADLNALVVAHTQDVLWQWQTAAANSSQALGRGSTDTAIATGKFIFAIGGMPEAKAAVTTGTAIGAQTVPADTWALYRLDIATGGTITVTAAAANATTGYATEALAIAALPASVTAKAPMGYITVKTKAATAWIAATDGLAGGSSGNFASTTNYYPTDGVFASTGTSYTGGKNGIAQIATVLSRGSTDTNLASTAFTYNARGVNNIAKAAVAAGTAFGALGTIPADKWGLIVAYIDSVGTISFQSAPLNYSTGYGTELAAINALSQVTQTANVARMGYVTIKTKAATAFIVGTDGLAGGSSGNVASTTNYYPQAAASVPVGMLSTQVGDMNGSAITA